MASIVSMAYTHRTVQYSNGTIGVEWLEYIYICIIYGIDIIYYLLDRSKGQTRFMPLPTIAGKGRI